MAVAHSEVGSCKRLKIRRKLNQMAIYYPQDASAGKGGEQAKVYQ